MKKLILVTSIFVAGVASAKTVAPNNGGEKTEKKSDIEKANSVKGKLVRLDPGVIYYTGSCGIQVSTYQPNWGWAEAQGWAAQIEQNYCN